jgi:aspartyl-tRNA(Asn)/glutamyl-tRNA(Gln) amidotransferase subunit B
VAGGLPELPYAKYRRFMTQHGLNSYDAWRLTEQQSVADYFEQAAKLAPPKGVANWILGDLFSLIHQAGQGDIAEALRDLKISPKALAQLIHLVADGQINQSSGKEVLAEMFASGGVPEEIVKARGLRQVSDTSVISGLVSQILKESPKEVASYKAGKTAVANFLFGQVMKKAAGKANPQVVREELERQLSQ